MPMLVETHLVMVVVVLRSRDPPLFVVGRLGLARDILGGRVVRETRVRT